MAINTAFISSATYIYAVYKEISKFLGPRLKCVVFPDFLQHFELVHTRTLFKHLARWSDEFAQKLGRAAVVIVCRVHGRLGRTAKVERGSVLCLPPQNEASALKTVGIFHNEARTR